MAVTALQQDPDGAMTDLRLAQAMPRALGLGPYLKATLCLIDGDRARVTAVAGDLADGEAVARYEALLEDLLATSSVAPEIVAHDLHPDFYSSRIAGRFGVETLAVQHHHAHIAAVAAEHKLTGPLLGLALDGFGLGPNGEAWGGELLRVDGADCQRLGGLAPLPQPGGDRAAREPWRMAAAALHKMGRGDEIADRFADRRHASALRSMLESGVNCPSTSSAGRLFDAACGLLGVRPVADFEGQAPQELEAMVTRPRVMANGWRIDAEGDLDTLPLLAALIDREAVDGAALFHGTLAAALADWVARAARETGLRRVALGGGCFFNTVLRRALVAALATTAIEVLAPRQVSPGDAGLSLGQAWIAAHRRAGK